MLPGSEILDALAQDNLDAADYTGPAVNLALGFQKVAKYVSMGPPGFMSIYQPVDLMDITVAMPAWQALSPGMQAFLEDEVRVYSLLHHTQVEAADQQAWKEFDAAGVEVSRLSDADVVAFPQLAVPRWFSWANQIGSAARVFRIHLHYMISGSL